MKQLDYTADGTTHFLNQDMGLGLSVDLIAALGERAEGWIAGLQLAALSMHAHTDPSEFIRTFTGTHHCIFDYLTEQLLAQIRRSAAERSSDYARKLLSVF